MAGNTVPIFVKIPRGNFVKLTTGVDNIDGSGSTLLFTADAINGSRIHALSITPSGTISAACVVRVFLRKINIYYLLFEVGVPTSTSSTSVAVPTYNCLEYANLPFIDPADRFLALGPGEDLYVAVRTSPTNALHVSAMGGDY